MFSIYYNYADPLPLFFNSAASLKLKSFRRVLMKKNIAALLLSFAFMAHHLVCAADPSSDASAAKKINDTAVLPKTLLYGGACAEWKTSALMDNVSLDKLEKSSYSEKPQKGGSYTKNQLIVLLGKKLSSARDVLSKNKNKLQKTSDGLVDLRDAVLTGFDLSGLNLDYVNFRGANLKGANLSGSTLNYATLYKANLEEADLDHATINYSNVSKANLINSHMCEASLFYTDLDDATFLGANMKGARLDTAINIPSVMYLHSQSIFEVGLPVPPNYFDQ